MNRLPRDLGPGELVLSHFTLRRDHPIQDRLDAAVAGGFAGIGLLALDALRIEVEGIEMEELGDMLDARNLCLAELEVAKGWGGGPNAAEAPEIEAAAFRLADRFASRTLQAIGPFSGDIESAGRRFADLCDRAGDHGLQVALEPLPYTNIPDLPTALEVVQRAGRDNGGLCLDIWHHTRAGDDRAALRRLDPRRIVSVQMNDGPRCSSVGLAGYKDDCLQNRVPPGEGEMDAVGFVAALLAAGTTSPWSVEVCDASVTGSGIDHARRCGDAMRAVLAVARAEVGA